MAVAQLNESLAVAQQAVVEYQAEQARLNFAQRQL